MACGTLLCVCSTALSFFVYMEHDSVLIIPASLSPSLKFFFFFFWILSVYSSHVILQNNGLLFVAVLYVLVAFFDADGNIFRAPMSQECVEFLFYATLDFSIDA